jgi:hypothetical protein
MRKRIASDTRYMSLRVLPTTSAGIRAIEPYWVTWVAMSRTRIANDG